MNLALFFVLGVVLFATVVGGIVAYFGIRRAPEGFEDASGFHPSVTRERVVPAPQPLSRQGTHGGIISLRVHGNVRRPRTVPHGRLDSLARGNPVAMSVHLINPPNPPWQALATSPQAGVRAAE